jgi:NADH:ubiquinone oxidoreductase subunit H
MNHVPELSLLRCGKERIHMYLHFHNLLLMPLQDCASSLLMKSPFFVVVTMLCPFVQPALRHDQFVSAFCWSIL